MKEILSNYQALKWLGLVTGLFLKGLRRAKNQKRNFEEEENNKIMYAVKVCRRMFAEPDEYFL